MANEVVYTGTNANDGTGDTLRSAMTLVNARFTTDRAESIARDTVEAATRAARDLEIEGQVASVAASFNIRTWATGQSYGPGTIGSLTDKRDIVLVSGVWYVAAVEHVAGASFATDLAAGKWLTTDPVQLRGDLADTGTGKGAQMIGGNEIAFGSYAAMKAYTGQRTAFRINVPGIAGQFETVPGDTTTAEDGGIWFVRGDGVRVRRVYSGAINLAWFGAEGDDATDNATELQNWANTLEGQVGEIPEGVFRSSSSTDFPGNVTIIGSGRNSSLIKYTGNSTASSKGVFAWDHKSHIDVSGVGFRWTGMQPGNESVGLYFLDCTNVEVDGITHGATVPNGYNRTCGILFESSGTYTVPPVGNAEFRNVLAVTEGGASGAGNSAGVWIKGHPSSKIIHVILGGEANMEHHAYGVRMTHCNNSWIGPGWQIRGNTNTEIALESCSGVTICAPQIIPTLTTGKGLTIDSGCVDTVVIAPQWNISSGAPAVLFDDQGARTTVIAPGAPGGGFAIIGKMQGPYSFRKGDGIGDNLTVIRSATDVGQSGEVLRKSGVNTMGVNAWRIITVGDGIGGQDVERYEYGEGASQVIGERVSPDGRRFLRVLSSSPGGSALAASQLVFYLDEAGHNLIALVKYSNGTTLRAATIPVL